MPDELRDVDKTIAFILEIALGLFGFLGIGHMYAGLIKEGVIKLVIWLAVVYTCWIVVVILSYFLIGICFIPFMLVAQIGVPIWSAFHIKKKLDEAFPNSK